LGDDRFLCAAMKFVFVIGLAVGLGVSMVAQVPNGGFENWTDCAPDFWATSDACGVLEPVTKNALAHSGSFAAKGEVITFFGQTIAPVLQSGDDATGVPITERYGSVDGFYIFTPVGGDRFGVNVAFYLGDSVVVAQGAALFPATAANAYSAFSVPMTYTTQDVPDRAIIQFQVIGPVTGNDYHVGSVMYLDDIAFGTGGGGPEARLSIVRNANGSVTISWAADVVGYLLQQTASLTPASWGDVAGLAAGDRSFTTTPVGESYFRLVKP
jgi:hypothetical protein